jgi:hypothetical protein
MKQPESAGRAALAVLLALLAAGSGAAGLVVLGRPRTVAAEDAGKVPSEAPPTAAAGARPALRAVKEELARREPAQHEPAQHEPAQHEPAQHEPVRSGPVPPRPGAPVRLAIGSAVTAPVEPVGAGSDRELVVPERPRAVGWWVGSAPAGSARGSTLLAGHIDSASRGRGALAVLPTLPLGTRIVLTDVYGAGHPYVVTARRSYHKTTLPADVLRTGTRPRLVLVTCGGPFDEAQHSYRDNIVVYARPA